MPGRDTDRCGPPKRPTGCDGAASTARRTAVPCYSANLHTRDVLTLPAHERPAKADTAAKLPIRIQQWPMAMASRSTGS